MIGEHKHITHSKTLRMIDSCKTPTQLTATRKWCSLLYDIRKQYLSKGKCVSDHGYSDIIQLDLMYKQYLWLMQNKYIKLSIGLTPDIGY